MSAAISSTAFKQWLLSIGKSERTAKSYAGAIQNTLSQLSRDHELTTGGLYSVQEPGQLYHVSEAIQTLPAFREMNDRGKGMYSAALKQYADFLFDITGQELREDVEQILTDDTIGATDKATLVNTRIGQGRFRAQLIEHWGGCAVTGYRDVRFLVASHIKPWRVASHEERLSPYNGLLLLPNLDKVFDLGYVTFADSGQIHLSEQLEDHSALGLTPEMRVRLGERHREYMAYHRDHRFIQ